MKYVVFASGGKQYKVNEGSIVELEKLTGEEGTVLTFDTVMLFAEDDAIKLGQPYLSDVTVSAKILSQFKAKKIRVAKFKAKARYRKVIGHRQHLTKVQIEKFAVKAGKTTKTKEETTTEKE